MTTGAAEIRHVEIVPLSARAELGNVIRLALAICVGAWMFAALRAGVVGDAEPARRNFLPFQALIQDRPVGELRMFRELHEALLETEVRRATNGAWPEVATLTAEGVPPFAFDPTVKDGRTDWQLLRSGAVINYLGRPQRRDGSAWLLLIQEPVPGVPPDQNFEDEEHHRLTTGEMLHVSVWVHANGASVAPQLVRVPQSEGWTQLYSKQ